jgi:hypothetical protein
MRDVEEPDRCSTVRPNIVVNRPFLITSVLRLLVVRFICLILGERVGSGSQKI